MYKNPLITADTLLILFFFFIFYEVKMEKKIKKLKGIKNYWWVSLLIVHTWIYNTHSRTHMHILISSANLTQLIAQHNDFGVFIYISFIISFYYW